MVGLALIMVHSAQSIVDTFQGKVMKLAFHTVEMAMLV